MTVFSLQLKIFRFQVSDFEFKCGGTKKLARPEELLRREVGKIVIGFVATIKRQYIMKKKKVYTL